MMAERVGFEPTEPFGSRALQARALGQTTLPLRLNWAKHYNMRLNSLPQVNQAQAAIHGGQVKQFAAIRRD
jgi:hypothetical protein